MDVSSGSARGCRRSSGQRPGEPVDEEACDDHDGEPAVAAFRAVSPEAAAVVAWLSLLAHSVHVARLLGHRSLRVAVIGDLSNPLRDALDASTYEMSRATDTPITVVEPPLDADPHGGPIGLVVADRVAGLAAVAAQPWIQLLPDLPVWLDPADGPRRHDDRDVARLDEARRDLADRPCCGTVGDERGGRDDVHRSRHEAGHDGCWSPSAGRPGRVLASPAPGSEHEGAGLVLHALDHPGRSGPRLPAGVSATGSHPRPGANPPVGSPVAASGLLLGGSPLSGGGRLPHVVSHGV